MRLQPAGDIRMRDALDAPTAKILQILCELRVLLGRQERGARRAAHGSDDWIDRLGRVDGLRHGEHDSTGHGFGSEADSGASIRSVSSSVGFE